ncbi:MAG TPA: hypothetical protein DCE22_01650 [Verrucomicrobiales bacterium]|nr:hypothetical protein [Verrucomicrobiales bacterium]|tara:strand:- start:509 stop:1318 length:810 start_codon:yes stop_codon:yes gene_type:complete
MNSSGTNSHSKKELSDDKILRRDFTSNSIKTILSISLLEHLCATDLLANKDKYTAKKWLHAVHEIGRSVKETKIPQTQWQKEVEELFQNKIELNELLKLINFDQIEKSAKFVDNGARSIRPKLPRSNGFPERLAFGSQVFALKKGRSVVPHGHNNMATAFIVLKGNFHGRHYDRISDEKEHMIIRPTIDDRFGPGQTSSVSDDKDNVHWFKAEDEPAFIFNIHVLGLPNKKGAPRRTGRLYIDPEGEKLGNGLIRAPFIDSKKAHQKYG